MKFVHIGDLHLGKVIHQCSLLSIQRELLFELLDEMDQRNIRLLVIAGDIYDRLIPSQEAVNLLDEFLTKALLTYHIEVLMISGNHDSSDRLHFASSLLVKNGLHIETYLKEKMVYVEKENVRFYLLPFVKPSQVRMLYPDQEIHTYQEALAYYLSKQSLDHDYQNILVTHQFVGHSSITSESEVPLSVGGSEIIDASLFDDFDYVALGHLHAPQKVKRETMRYSGSLMCYSFDEVKQKKSVVVVDTDTMEITTFSLHPSQTLQKYQGTFAELMDVNFIEKKGDYLSFELLDQKIIPHAIEQLRVLYPHLLQLTYQYLMKDAKQSAFRPMQSIEQMDTLSLFQQFYHDVKNQELSNLAKDVVQELLEKAGEKSEDY